MCDQKKSKQNKKKKNKKKKTKKKTGKIDTYHSRTYKKHPQIPPSWNPLASILFAQIEKDLYVFRNESVLGIVGVAI